MISGLPTLDSLMPIEKFQEFIVSNISCISYVGWDLFNFRIQSWQH